MDRESSQTVARESLVAQPPPQLAVLDVIAVARYGGFQMVRHIEEVARGMQRHMTRPAARLGCASITDGQLVAVQGKDVEAIASQIGAEEVMASGVKDH